MRKAVALKPIRDDAETILHALQQVPNLVIPGVTPQEIQDNVASLDSVISDITQQEKELETKRIRRDSLLRITSDHCVRARMAVKSQFGSNSVEYNYFGGTPDYNRKARSSRTPEIGFNKLSA